jgi:hypothetical protein
MYLQSLNTFLNKSNGNGTRNTSVRDNYYYRDNHHNISAQVSISIVFVIPIGTDQYVDILYTKGILLTMDLINN